MSMLRGLQRGRYKQVEPFMIWHVIVHSSGSLFGGWTIFMHAILTRLSGI